MKGEGRTTLTTEPITDHASYATQRDEVTLTEDGGRPCVPLPRIA